MLTLPHLRKKSRMFNGNEVSTTCPHARAVSCNIRFNANLESAPQSFLLFDIQA